MKKVALFLLLLANAPAQAQSACKDELCTKLVAQGMSAKAWDVMTEMVQRLKYTKDVVAIADYTIPSAKERFFLINLKTKTFKAIHVSHGAGTGGADAVRFGNVPGIQRSSLGFYRTSNMPGTFGRSLFVRGISKSSERPANAMPVLIHCAEYSSDTFYKNHGYWGRSFGCLAIPCEYLDEVMDTLGPDALVLSYHEALWDQAFTNPSLQEVPGHGPIPPASKWETDENFHGLAGAPYKVRYKNEPYENAAHDR